MKNNSILISLGSFLKSSIQNMYQKIQTIPGMQFILMCTKYSIQYIETQIVFIKKIILNIFHLFTKEEMLVISTKEYKENLMEKTNQIAILELNIQDINQKLNDLKSATEKDQQQQQQEKIQQDSSTMTEESKTECKKIDDKLEESKLKSSMDKLKEQYTQSTNESTKLGEENTTLRKQLTDLQQKLDCKQNKISNLEDELILLASSVNTDHELPKESKIPSSELESEELQYDDLVQALRCIENQSI